MTASTAELGRSAPAHPILPSRTAASQTLRTSRLNLMRVGYLVMAVGLALTKCPLFAQGTAASLPLFEGVVAACSARCRCWPSSGFDTRCGCLPLLRFESAWKLIWLAAVAVQSLLSGDMSPRMSSLLFSVSLVVIIIAVTPWDHVWKRFVTAPGDPWVGAGR